MSLVTSITKAGPSFINMILRTRNSLTSIATSNTCIVFTFLHEQSITGCKNRACGIGS